MPYQSMDYVVFPDVIRGYIDKIAEEKPEINALEEFAERCGFKGISLLTKMLAKGHKLPPEHRNRATQKTVDKIAKHTGDKIILFAKYDPLIPASNEAASSSPRDSHPKQSADKIEPTLLDNVYNCWPDTILLNAIANAQIGQECVFITSNFGGFCSRIVNAIQALNRRQLDIVKDVSEERVKITIYMLDPTSHSAKSLEAEHSTSNQYAADFIRHTEWFMDIKNAPETKLTLHLHLHSHRHCGNYFKIGDSQFFSPHISGMEHSTSPMFITQMKGTQLWDDLAIYKDKIDRKDIEPIPIQDNYLIKLKKIFNPKKKKRRAQSAAKPSALAQS